MHTYITHTHIHVTGIRLAQRPARCLHRVSCRLDASLRLKDHFIHFSHGTSATRKAYAVIRHPSGAQWCASGYIFVRDVCVPTCHECSVISVFGSSSAQQLALSKRCHWLRGVGMYISYVRLCCLTQKSAHIPCRDTSESNPTALCMLVSSTFFLLRNDAYTHGLRLCVCAYIQQRASSCARRSARLLTRVYACHVKTSSKPFF